MAESQKAAKKALRKLDDQLTCAICLDTYNNPRVLPCLHVFCEDCLERLVLRDAANLTATCPNCRRETQLPQGGVADLPAAFYVNHLFEVRDTLEKVKDPNKTQCEKCGESEAKGYCRNCGEFVCQTCITIHGKWKEFVEHEVVTLGQVEADVAQLVPPKKVAMKCSKHPSEELKIYCETCDELICRDCTIKTHRDHQFDLVGDCFTKHRDSIVASLQPIKQQLDTVNQAVAEVDGRSTRIAENGATIKFDIQTAIDKLHEALEDRKQQLMAQLDQMVGQTSKTLAAQRDHYQLTQTQLASCLEFVEESLRTGSPQEVLSMKKPVVERVQQMAKEFQPNHFQPGPEETIYFYHKQLTDACKKFGDTTISQIFPEKCHLTGDGAEEARIGEETGFTLHTVDKDGKECADPNAPITAELVSRGDGAAVKCQVARKENNTYELKYQPQSHGQHDLLVKVYGRPIKNSPFTVAVRKATTDCQGMNVRTITGLKGPRHLAVTTEGQIVVAEYFSDCVSVFDREGHKLRSFGHQGSSLSKLSWPHGVALCRDNSVLVATDHCVKKYSLDGTFTASVGTEGSGKLEFNTPYAVATNDKTELIYVCDTKNGRIQILNEDLTYCSNFGSKGSDPGQFQYPTDIVINRIGEVLIADYSNNRIQVFSPEGQFLYMVNKRGPGMEDLRGPISVSIDSDGFIYVLEFDACRISIFDNKGNFIKTFGKKGANAGEFSGPYGLTVDMNNYVYVSDTGNNRIQLFK